MAINWKTRAKKMEQDLFDLHERSKEVGWSLVKEKETCRKAAQDYMNAQQKLMRAITAIEAGAETFSAHRLHAHAATFRMIANDLAPKRDSCPIGVQEERT